MIGFLDDNCPFFAFEQVLFLARPQTLRRTENMLTIIDALNVTGINITNKTSYGFPREELLMNFFGKKFS